MINLDQIYLPDPVEKDHPLNRDRGSWWLGLNHLVGTKKLYDILGFKNGTIANNTNITNKGFLKSNDFSILNISNTTTSVVAVSNIVMPTNYTLACIIKPVSQIDTVAALISESLSKKFSYRSNGKLAWSDGSVHDSTGTVSVNTFAHVALVFLGTSGEFFINGISAGTFTASSQAISIASFATDGTTSYQGQIGDLSYWNRGLTGSELGQLSEESSQGYPKTLKRLKNISYFLVKLADTASNTLSLSHNVSYNTVYARSLSSSLTLVSSTSTPLVALVSNTISFSSNTTETIVYPRSVFHPLTITQSASYLRQISESLSSTISFVSSATGDKHRIVPQTITFNQNLDRQYIANKSIVSSLILTQSNRKNLHSASLTTTIHFTHLLKPKRVLKRSATTILNLSQIIMTPSAVLAVTTLNLSQALVEKGPRYQTANNLLGLVSNLDSVNSTYNISLVSDLQFEHTVFKPISETLTTQTITFTQVASASRGLSNTVVFNQIVAYVLAKHPVSILTFVSTVAPKFVLRKSLSHSLSFGSSVTYTLREPSLCVYAPVGSVITTVPPTYTKIDHIILTYPYVTPSTTLTLRMPDYENLQKHDYTRIIRETRGGTQKIYRQTAWPKSKILTYTISFNKEQQVRDFLNFLESSLGQEMGLLDYLNRQWKGIIINPDSISTHLDRFNRQINFDFDGVLV